MPGVVTHHVFGLDVYAQMEDVIGSGKAERQAFLLGNLGPDPFFYLEATPAPKEVRGIGRLMHRAKTVELLGVMHSRFIGGPTGGDAGDDASANGKSARSETEESRVLKAYALGFLCHYLLDSTVHPLVYAQQHAICKLQLADLSQTWANRIVHATIETAFDEHLLTTRFNSTAARMPPHTFALKCPAGALMQISAGFHDVVGLVYGINLVENAFFTAVSINRLGQLGLDSQSVGLRRRFDYLELLGKPLSQYLKSLSFNPRSLPYTAFANSDHIPWPHPYVEGEVVSSSFSDLYDETLFKALGVLPQYAKPDLAPAFCSDLVKGVSFLGRQPE